MAETTPEQNSCHIHSSNDMGQSNGNRVHDFEDENFKGLERFFENNGILDDTHKIDILKQLIQCPRRFHQQSITDKNKTINDIHSLANIYCFVLTNKKWQNYSEELTIEDIHCSDPNIALDILRLMVSTPSIEDVFRHPFYWSDFTKVYFICIAVEFINSKTVKSKKAEDISILKRNMHEVSDVITGDDWIAALELTSSETRNIAKNRKIGRNVISKLAQKRVPGEDSVFQLMRFFRNRYIHHHEDMDDTKIAFGGYPSGYLRFFTSRFPNLFMHLYRNMKQYLEQGTNLERYFLNDWTTLVNSLRSSVIEASPDVLLSNQPPAKDFFSEARKSDECTTEKTYIGESSGTTSHKEIQTIYFDVAKPPEDTQQDQLHANEQLFRDAGKSDEYTTELGVKGSIREMSNLTLLNKSLHSSETEGEPVRKSASDVPPSNETPTCQSKSVIIRYEKDDCTSNVEIFKIENIIKLYSEVDMIEFCDCKVGNDYCTPEERGQKSTAKCKISKLIISYTDHFKEFSGFFYSTFGGCEIKTLCLVYANLDDQDVEKLQSFMVESLDISYNKKITRDGFERIGKMIADQGTLRAIDCDLGEMKFEKLWEGLKNVNLRELDIGYNSKLAEGGFEMLAKLVASRGIKTLKLRGCQITEKTIQVFYNKLKMADENVMLNELDVSYNRKMNPAGCEVLGWIIKKFGITTLNLAGCQISEEHLTSLMSIKDIELHAINLSDNFHPGNIIIQIANIVNEFKIQELDISDCMLSARELKNFRTKLKGTKLQKLHLGDKNCEFGIEYIEEVCEFLPLVREMLYLQFLRVDNSCRRLLKKQKNLSFFN